MTPAPPRLGVRWIAAEIESVRRVLAAALGVDTPAGVPVDIPGLRLEISAATAAVRVAAATLLLEPDTEGRIAASLARHGEGPAVLYVGLAVPAVTAARARLARLGVRVASGPGPFGPEVAITGTPSSGPTLVIVPLPRPRRDGGEDRRRRGTIDP